MLNATNVINAVSTQSDACWIVADRLADNEGRRDDAAYYGGRDYDGRCSHEMR